MSADLLQRLELAFNGEPFTHNGEAAVGRRSEGRIHTPVEVTCSEADLRQLRRDGTLPVVEPGVYSTNPFYRVQVKSGRLR